MTSTAILFGLIGLGIGFIAGTYIARERTSAFFVLVQQHERMMASERIATAVQAGRERSEWAEAREKQAAEALRQVMEFSGLKARPASPKPPPTQAPKAVDEKPVDYRYPGLRSDGVAIAAANPAHDETSLQSTAGGGSPLDAGELEDAFAEQVAGLASLEAK